MGLTKMQCERMVPLIQTCDHVRWGNRR